MLVKFEHKCFKSLISYEFSLIQGPNYLSNASMSCFTLFICSSTEACELLSCSESSIFFLVSWDFSSQRSVSTAEFNYEIHPSVSWMTDCCWAILPSSRERIQSSSTRRSLMETFDSSNSMVLDWTKCCISIRKLYCFSVISSSTFPNSCLSLSMSSLLANCWVFH